MKHEAVTASAVHLLLSVLILGGCASSGELRFWRDPRGHIVVAGPMLGPFDSVSALAPRLCASICEMPGATA